MKVIRKCVGDRRGAQRERCRGKPRRFRLRITRAIAGDDVLPARDVDGRAQLSVGSWRMCDFDDGVVKARVQRDGRHSDAARRKTDRKEG